MYAMQECMGRSNVGANKKGLRTEPLSFRWNGSVLGEADRDGGGGDGGAQHQQEHGGQTVEQPFEVGERRERHDTHLSVGNHGGAGAFLFEQR